jgi:hypothetical protein
MVPPSNASELAYANFSPEDIVDQKSGEVLGANREPEDWLDSARGGCGASCSGQATCGGRAPASGCCDGCGLLGYRSYGPWCCSGGCGCRCDDICWDGAGGRYNANYLNRSNLLWVIRPSDTRFLNFVSPLTNPVWFEDPRNLTEARVLFLNHHLPGALGGGAVQLVATQVRLALTQRLSLIAVKDGYIFQGSSALPLEGWANVNLGLKYNLYANALKQQIFSVGTRYEMASGTNHNFQGNGDGQFDIFASGGTQIGQYSHFLSAAGFRLPANRSDQNQQF